PTYGNPDKVDPATRERVPASGTYAAQDDITTVYLRDLGGLDCGCDGEVTAITTGGSLLLETQTKKDPIGRLTYQKDAVGLETFYAYALAGRQVTRTNPDGGTTIHLMHPDRRLASLTGSGVISKYFDYGVNDGGTKWRKI